MKKSVLISLVVIGTFLLIDYQMDIYSYFGISIPKGYTRFYLYHSICLMSVLGATALLFGLRNTLSALGLDKGMARGMGYGFLFTLPMFLGYAVTGQWQGIDGFWRLVNVFIGASMEEVVYRGFLFGLLFRKAKWGFLAAVLLNALIFGTAHLYQGQTFGQTAGIFMVTLAGGIWFAWLYIEWENNLWIAISLHFFMNLAWKLFAMDNTALGDWGANLFRIMTIALSIVFTLIHRQKAGGQSIVKQHMWKHRKPILLASCLLMGQCLFAQQSLRGSIQDAQGQPLSYVNIGLVGTTTGTVSKEDGTFILYFQDNVNPTDSLRCSMIGYKSQTYLISELQDSLLVQLTEDVIELEQVVVRPKFPKTVVKGMTKSKGRMSVNFSISGKPRQNLGAEIGKRIRLKNKLSSIEAFNFYIRQNNYEAVKFRVLIYSIQKGKPHRFLSTEDIIIHIDNQQKGWIKVDLTPYELITDKDFIIALQWIDASDKGNYLSLPIRLPVVGSNHFYKFGSQAHWKRFRNMSSAMNVQLAQ
ncbi:MAG: CPBP family glutamic-type intramembrane protease [Bacteroidota bacterium]